MESNSRIYRNLTRNAIAVFACVLTFGSSVLHADQIQLSNDRYEVSIAEDGVFTVEEAATGFSRSFAPAFEVIYHPLSPGLPTPTLVQTIEIFGAADRGMNYRVAQWNPSGKPQTRNMWESGTQRIPAVYTGHAQDGDSVRFDFATHSHFQLQAWLTVPDDGTEPEIRFVMTAETGGRFSVVYTGAEEAEPSELDWLWQPMLWNGLRFPREAIISLEFQTSLPLVLAGQDGGLWGVIADASEMPFRLPTFTRSRFGVAIRNAAGRAQPVIAAPALGFTGSQKQAGQTHEFRFRVFAFEGDQYEAYRRLAAGLYGFRDHRVNYYGNTNTLLDNLDDYVLGSSGANWVGWNDDAKGFDGRRDNPGQFTNQSPSQPLALSIVRDSRELLERRAIPSLEQVMSRNRVQMRLLNNAMTAPQYDPDRAMLGPNITQASDIASAYVYGKRRFPVMSFFAIQNLHPNLNPPAEPTRQQALRNGRIHLRNMLALYRVTQNSVYLDHAIKLADDYIAERIHTAQVDFYDMRSSFWTEIGPVWIDIFSLYEETGEERFLHAAYEGAKEFSAFIFYAPAIPDAEVTVHPGGTVTGVRGTMNAPEETVPAWLVSEIGLIAEAAGTHTTHRAIFMVPWAAYFMRLAHLMDDPFLRDVARAAVIGRYQNYPGYHINTNYATVFMKENFPLRRYDQINYTSVHYHHPIIKSSMLVDYLVSEVWYRSAGQIDFPSRFAVSSAYFQQNIYGDRPGEVFGDSAHIWIPGQLLQTDSIALDHIAAYNEDGLYLIFLNQSFDEVETTFSLNAERTVFGSSHTGTIRRETESASPIAINNGEATVSVAPRGMTTVFLEGVKPILEVQDKFVDAPVGEVENTSWQLDFSAAGRATGQIFSIARGLGAAHLWITSGPDEVSRAVFRYETNSRSGEFDDTSWPFEHTVPLGPEDYFVRYSIEAYNSQGTNVIDTGERELRLTSAGPDSSWDPFSLWLEEQLTPAEIRSPALRVPEFYFHPDARLDVRVAQKRLTSSTGGEAATAGILFGIDDGDGQTNGWLARIDRMPGEDSYLAIAPFVSGQRGEDIAVSTGFPDPGFNTRLYLDLETQRTPQGVLLHFRVYPDSAISGENLAAKLSNEPDPGATPLGELELDWGYRPSGLVGLYFEDNSSGNPQNPDAGIYRMDGLRVSGTGMRGVVDKLMTFTDAGTPDPDRYLGTRGPGGRFDDASDVRYWGLLTTLGETFLTAVTTGRAWVLMDDVDPDLINAGRGELDPRADLFATGRSLLYDFFTGNNPRRAEPETVPSLAVVDDQLVFEFSRSDGAKSMGLDYSVEVSTNLQEWQFPSGSLIETIDDEHERPFEWIRYQWSDESLGESGRLFYRLRVNSPF